MNNGGPAFPYSGVHKGEKENLIVDSHGMTLRDYFAAMAMQGRLANPDWLCSNDRTAKEAYQIADAMLRARETS
ncbi:hypothetical protein RCR42_05390 [Enterobacter hormaechei]|uniref:hypothetical protein n=1 Tax=Enterobacter hormaechei TaxID=158836 RepID=UPI002812690C|nr:hypothetical protein [Enterobacter hormaechei]WMQ87821.1 hypothetical protein RCR42_05390 [Enterobacter hormaechei]